MLCVRGMEGTGGEGAGQALSSLNRRVAAFKTCKHTQLPVTPMWFGGYLERSRNAPAGVGQGA